jgi:hypothetical protein
MGYYIDPEGNYPRHAGDIQLVIPEWNEATDPLPDGWIDVAEGTIPEIAEGYELVELAPKSTRGKYARRFTTQLIAPGE